MSIKIYTSVNHINDYVGLWQILQKWEEYKFCEIESIPMTDGRYAVWVGKVGGLYLEPSDPRPMTMPYEWCLCSQFRQAIHGQDKRILPWNFYVRDWKSYDEVRLQYETKRTIKSLFSGTIRSLQHSRNLWRDSTEVYSARTARTFNRTNTLYPTLKDYYNAVHSTRYLLCLGGDGGDKSVCQRETEGLGLGTVCIFDKHVEHIYHGPMIEDKHFIRADTPAEMNAKIDAMSQDKWEEMSMDGEEYFKDYCTPEGLWATVMEIVDTKGIKI